MIKNGLNIGSLQVVSVEKLVHGMKLNWFSDKEKVLGSALSKGGHADMKGVIILIDLFWKGATIDSVSYCQYLRQNSP